MNTSSWHDFMGELLGTFILVLFGCGSVAVTVLFGALTGLMQIAMVWGMAVTLAIYSTRHLSFAHFNPAVSLAMVVAGRMRGRFLPVYFAGQFSGAFIAAALLYLLFGSSIAEFETANSIVRGAPESIKSAMIFGEYYPNPGSGSIAVVSGNLAFLAEAVGTFCLMLFILLLTDTANLGKPKDSSTPVFIGIALTLIISIIAPLTQAGLNPARDFSPRILTVIAGWGDAAFPDKDYGFITVYMFGPVLGAVSASLLFTKLIQPLMTKKTASDANS
ncbi:MAG: aquaporin [Spirochaetota bacterium]|nr:aquaporin [Spirochaetota bacterium]